MIISRPLTFSQELALNTDVAPSERGATSVMEEHVDVSQLLIKATSLPSSCV